MDRDSVSERQVSEEASAGHGRQDEAKLGSNRLKIDVNVGGVNITAIGEVIKNCIAQRAWIADVVTQRSRDARADRGRQHGQGEDR